MARITGKNAKIRGELSRTSVTSYQVMTDSGDHKTYSYNSYWNPNLPPSITKNTVAVDRNLYTVNYINGTITFTSANDPADVLRIKDIEYSTMQDVGDMFNWTIDAKLDVIPVTAFQDQFREQLSGFRNWAGTAEGYHVSGFWFSAFNLAKPFYLEFYPDAGALERFVGAAFVDLGTKVTFDAAVTESLTFNGTGELARKTS